MQATPAGRAGRARDANRPRTRTTNKPGRGKSNTNNARNLRTIDPDFSISIESSESMMSGSVNDVETFPVRADRRTHVRGSSKSSAASRGIDHEGRHKDAPPPSEVFEFVVDMASTVGGSLELQPVSEELNYDFSRASVPAPRVDKIDVDVQPSDEDDKDIIINPDADLDGDIDLGYDVIDLSSGGSSAVSVATSTARRVARKAAENAGAALKKANKGVRGLSHAMEPGGLQRLNRRTKSLKRGAPKTSKTEL